MLVTKVRWEERMKEDWVDRIAMGSIFKLVGMGLLFSLFPFILLMGVLAAFGHKTLHWNNEPVTGFAAVLAAPLIGAFMVGFFTMFMGTAISFGIWVYSLMGPFTLSLRTTPPEPEVDESETAGVQSDRP
jgi:hypothetical protein